MIVFREYDQAGLDAQYNIRARVPEFQTHFDQWTAESAKVRSQIPNRLDVPYGTAPMERLDFFPTGTPRAPLVLFFHGGYWQALDKADFSFLAPLLTARGIAFASANYTLAPAATLDQIAQQARSAVAWCWRNADMLEIDTARIMVCGHSAGGQLATLCLTTDWPAFAPDLPAKLVNSGAAISGIYDLEPIRLSYQNPVLKLTYEMARANSPLFQVRPGLPPLLLGLGGKESAEFHRQNDELAHAWQQAGNPVKNLKLPTCDHFTVMHEGAADPQNPLFQSLVSLVETGRF